MIRATTIVCSKEILIGIVLVSVATASQTKVVGPAWDNITVDLTTTASTIASLHETITALRFTGIATLSCATAINIKHV